MSIADFHGRLAITALLFSIGMALWGFLRYFRKQEVDSSYFGGLVIGEFIYLVQAGLGVYLFLSAIGQLERPFVHILYGVVSLMTLPAVYIYTRGDESRRSMLLYSASFLFLIGITFRSITTGG